MIIIKKNSPHNLATQRYLLDRFRNNRPWDQSQIGSKKLDINKENKFETLGTPWFLETKEQSCFKAIHSIHV